MGVMKMNKKKFDRIIPTCWSNDQLNEIAKTIEIVKQNSLFKKISRAELIRIATTQFCDRIRSAHNTLKNKIPESAEEIFKEVIEKCNNRI